MALKSLWTCMASRVLRQVTPLIVTTLAGFHWPLHYIPLRLCFIDHRMVSIIAATRVPSIGQHPKLILPWRMRSSRRSHGNLAKINMLILWLQSVGLSSVRYDHAFSRPHTLGPKLLQSIYSPHQRTRIVQIIRHHPRHQKPIPILVFNASSSIWQS